MNAKQVGRFRSREEQLAAAGKVLGVVVFLMTLGWSGPDDLPAEAQRLAAVTLLMAVLWLSQAIPIAATALIPLIAFPLMGIQTADTVSKSYINANVFLFLGGFLIALGIEKWNLHRRMALHIVRILGSSLRRVVLGFMLATAFLSMWISNTASTLLMLPIALALLTSINDVVIGDGEGTPDELDASGDIQDPVVARLSVVLMLGIAYAASIGGFTSLVGTPTNVQFVQIWSDRFPEAPAISAGQWMTAVLPCGVLMIICTWGALICKLPELSSAHQLDRSFFSARLRKLGRPRREELSILAVFIATATLWIFRTPLKVSMGEPLLPGWGIYVEQWLIQMGSDPEFASSAVHDSTVAIAMAVLMFFIPARRNEATGKMEYLMDWKTAETKLPWGILLLIGGGFALAKAFSDTGLAQWTGDRFAVAVADWPLWLLVASSCFLMTFLTEFTSNVATVSALLPILAGTAIAIGVDPRLIMIPATISTSCAFMLPIATPPNAIVFGSGKIQMGQMATYGIVLNLLGVVLITATTFFLLVPQLGISLSGLPDWAK